MPIPHLCCPLEKHARGSRHGSAKLKESDVLDIFELSAEGLGTRELGRWYGVDHSTISRILSRQRWQHLSPTSVVSRTQ